MYNCSAAGFIHYKSIHPFLSSIYKSYNSLNIYNLEKYSFIEPLVSGFSLRNCKSWFQNVRF
jgi:hypothetical protein